MVVEPKVLRSGPRFRPDGTRGGRSLTRLLTSNFPQRLKFSGHETFPFRYTWLAKLVQRAKEDPRLFQREDAPVILGVGKNMVRSIRHWGIALGLLETLDRGQKVRPTRLGRLIFDQDGWDPYLEDIGTLWLLHWQLVKNIEQASTWNLVFTVYGKNEFTRQELTEWILSHIGDDRPKSVSPSSIKRDVDVFVRTYVRSRDQRKGPIEDSFDCPLVELGLIEEVTPGHYEFPRREFPSLPQEVFVYSLLDYWQLHFPENSSLTFEQVFIGVGSPSAAFRLSENAMMGRLERLPTWSGLRLDETAGRRVILRVDGEGVISQPVQALERYYHRGREVTPVVPQ